MGFTGALTLANVATKNKMSTTNITPVETFRWIEYAKIRGFAFSRDGVTLNGMITLPVGEELESFDKEWDRYSSTNATVVYSDKLDAKQNRIILRTVWGPFSDLSKDDALAALKQFLTSEPVV